MASISTKPHRIQSANATFLDAFIRSPTDGSKLRARVVLVGIDVHLPNGGRQLYCRFAATSSGGREPEFAGMGTGTGDETTCNPGCYQAWSCPIPHSVYNAALRAGAADISLHVGTKGRPYTSVRASLTPYTSASQSNVRIGATTMVRDDIKGRRASFLEHIEYHRLLGFDRWYVYDNDGTDGTRELLSRYAAAEPQAAVRIVSWPHRRKAKEGNNRVQRAALNHVLYAFAHHLDWLAFIDFDEFLALPQRPPWARDTYSLQRLWSRSGGATCATPPSASRLAMPNAAVPSSCPYELLLLSAKDRESPASTDCGSSSSSDAVTAHVRRVSGCKRERTREWAERKKVWPTPKVMVSVNKSQIMPPPIISPHYYHPTSALSGQPGIGSPDRCAVWIDESAGSLKHFSASSLHGGTCAGPNEACVEDGSLDWAAEPLTQRMRKLLKQGEAVCDNVTTAAAGSAQWLQRGTAEAFGRGCLEPLAAEPVWPKSSCGGLADYLHALWAGRRE